jgi:hypothetical protein
MDPQQDLFMAPEPQPAAVLPASPIPEPDTTNLSLREWIRAQCRMPDYAECIRAPELGKLPAGEPHEYAPGSHST